ncbi:MAG: adenylate/guanylate cyclase domain-containing protein [Deltaproteobacteria bacterium]|nr:adenylate/guanylate cyclase domain-containing protein [Deltaproteobacteria bacterium]
MSDGPPQEVCRRLAAALLGAADLTGLDVARAGGVDLDDLHRLWRALGFPPVAADDRRFTRADVEMVRALRVLVDEQRADPSDVLQLTRVVGHAMARVGDAQVTAIAERLRARREDAATDASAGELAARIGELAPTLERLLGHVWRRHLVAALLRVAATPLAADRSAIVGFADLVDFTATSRALDGREITAIVDRFEAVAYEHVLAHGGRIVKTIGDEVMFSVDETAGAAAIALALVDAHTRDPRLPLVRVGIAGGPIVAWQGDLFGTTVNLASRLADFARPGTVVVSDEVGEALRGSPELALRHLRAVTLKGIGRARTWVVRRAG